VDGEVALDWLFFLHQRRVVLHDRRDGRELFPVEVRRIDQLCDIRELGRTKTALQVVLIWVTLTSRSALLLVALIAPKVLETLLSGLLT